LFNEIEVCYGDPWLPSKPPQIAFSWHAKHTIYKISPHTITKVWLKDTLESLPRSYCTTKTSQNLHCTQNSNLLVIQFGLDEIVNSEFLVENSQHNHWPLMDAHSSFKKLSEPNSRDQSWVLQSLVIIAR
jgi:hypothetical protein